MPRPRPHPNPDVLTLDEAAAYLRISRAKLAELIAHGMVPSYQLGRRRFFLISALEEWVRHAMKGGDVA